MRRIVSFKRAYQLARLGLEKTKLHTKRALKDDCLLCPGFALPTVVISSLMLMMVLIVAVSATMTIRTGLYAQYYNKLAQEAAESGVEVAESCLLESDYSVTWSTASPLRPSSNCKGTSSCTSSSCYIINNSRLRTTFIIGNPTGNGGRNLGISSLGRVELLNAEGKTWQTYEKTLGYHSSYSAIPQISGGAGWKDTGHIGFFLSEDKQLYGYGENGVAQILDSNVPSQIVFPSKCRCVISKKGTVVWSGSLFYVYYRKQ